MSSAASSRRGSYCSSDGGEQGRRRSSTGDVLRFRQRMRETSLYVSHEEIVDAEGSQNEGSTIITRNEPEIRIIAATIPTGDTQTTALTMGAGIGHTSDVGHTSGAALSPDLRTSSSANSTDSDTQLPLQGTAAAEPNATVEHSLIENVTCDL